MKTCTYCNRSVLRLNTLCLGCKAVIDHSRHLLESELGRAWMQAQINQAELDAEAHEQGE